MQENLVKISPMDELSPGEAMISRIGETYLMSEIQERDLTGEAIVPERTWFGNSPEELLLLAESIGLGNKVRLADFEVDLLRMSSSWTAVPIP